MNSTIGKIVVLALGILTVGASSGRAQIMNQVDFKMSQPFTVGNTTLAAGSYVIRPVGGEEQSVLEIAGANGHPAVMVDTNTIQPDGAGGGRLIFNKYKNLLALSQIFLGGGNTGYQLLQGHPEQRAAKTETPTKQTVAANAK